MYRCRQMSEGHLVWFNSRGRDENGKAIKVENFAEEQNAVANCLTEQLSVIRGELWYFIEHGMPLFEKLRSKIAVDVEIASIVERHPNVDSIVEFQSTLENGKYSCTIKIMTSFGLLDIQV